MSISLGNVFDVSNIILWTDYDAGGKGYLTAAEYNKYIGAGGYNTSTIPTTSDATGGTKSYSGETSTNTTSTTDTTSTASTTSTSSSGITTPDYSDYTLSNVTFTDEYGTPIQTVLAGDGNEYVADPDNDGLPVLLSDYLNNQSPSAANWVDSFTKKSAEDFINSSVQIIEQSLRDVELAKLSILQESLLSQLEDPNVSVIQRPGTLTLSSGQTESGGGLTQDQLTAVQDYFSSTSDTNAYLDRLFGDNDSITKDELLSNDEFFAVGTRLATTQQRAPSGDVTWVTTDQNALTRYATLQQDYQVAQAQAEEEEAQAEADRIAQAEADRIAQAEADRIAQAEADRIAAAEQARLVGEAQDIFKDQGYAPTPEEAEAFAGKTEQEIKDYIDPRQITYDEAKQAFEDEGYRATPEEIKVRMGQGDETFTETTEQEVADYVDPRYVTEAEAIEAFEAENGYKPTAEEIQDRIGQAEYDYPTDAAGQEEYARNTANHEQSELEDLADYVDKRQITAEEVKEFAAQNGLEISDEEAEKLAQQGDQAEIEAKSKEIFDDFDERFVTRSELEDIARAQNYDVANLSEEDYAELVGNGSESDVIKNIDSRATTIDELAEVFEQRTGIALDPFNPEDQKKLQDMLEGATADNGGSLTEEEFGKWAKENIEYDLGVQIGRLATGVRNAIFGTGPGGRPKTLQEILDDMLGPPGTGGFAGPSPLVITTTPSASASAVGLPRMAVQAEIKFPVPLPVNGPPIIIPLFDENGVYVGPSSVGELFVGEDGVITQVKENIETTVGQITEQAAQIFDAAGNVIKAIPLAELDNPNWEEGDKNPFEIEVDENGVPALVDENGIPIDPETGLPVYEMPETEDEDDRLALLSDVEAAKEEVLNTLGDQLDALGLDVAEIEDIVNGVEESLVGVATLEDLEALREGVKEDLTGKLDGLGLDVDDINETLDGLDSSINSVSTRVGLPARPDDPNTEEDESRPATGLYAEIDALVAEGASRAEAVDEVLSNLSEQLGTTKDDILEQLGTTEANLAEDIEAVAEDVTNLGETLNDRIDALVDQGLSRAEAVDQALADLSDQLGTSTTDILDQLGTTEANLAEDIEAVAGDVEAVAGDLSDLAGIVDVYIAQGLTNDEALAQAISDLSDRLGVTEDTLLTSLGETEETILDAVEGVSAQIDATNVNIDNLNELVVQYELDGKTRDEALSLALSDLSADLGITKEEILTSIGESEETIIERIDASDESTDEYLTYISEIIGIPATDLTQEDIDFVVGLIGEDEAITEINNDVRIYDANFDGVINDIDIGLLQGFVDAGVDGVGEIPATGLYADAAQRQLELTGYISDQDDITRGLISDEAKTTRGLMGATTLFNAMLGAGDISGRRVDVSTPDPARINYIYDFEDVFATPQQRGLFPSPYGKPQMAQQQQMAQRQGSTSGPLQIGGMAQGGKVDYDFTDEIMQIMRYGDN